MARRRRSDGPLPLGTSLEQVAGRFQRVDLVGMAAVHAAWPDIVDEPLASHAEPFKITGSTLVVTVDRPLWTTQVRLMSPVILERLAEHGVDGLSVIEAVVRAR